MNRRPAMASRRWVLRGLTATGLLAAGMPAVARGTVAAAPTLVLVKLVGGNDGLNMVAPFGDPAYRRARPTIGLGADDVLDLGEGLGLHPGLAGLEDGWAADELAIVRGVGYRPVDRSHFRAMDVWETGGADAGPRDTGWLTRVLPTTPRPATPLDLLVLGTDPRVLVAGGGLTAYEIAAGATLRDGGPGDSAGTVDPANPALAHVLAVQRRLAEARAGLAETFARLPDIATPFPDDGLGRRLRLAARLIAAGSPAPVILVPVTGFDTHAGQRPIHDRLIAALGAGLAALRLALIETDRWRSATIATYSEFGRRLAENGSGGTDHGTAAPQLVIGGAVAGGWHGVQPSLTALDDRDPVPSVDLRAYLGGLAVAGLGTATAAVAAELGDVRPLALRMPA